MYLLPSDTSKEDFLGLIIEGPMLDYKASFSTTFSVPSGINGYKLLCFVIASCGKAFSLNEIWDNFLLRPFGSWICIGLII